MSMLCVCMCVCVNVCAVFVSDVVRLDLIDKCVVIDSDVIYCSYNLSEFVAFNVLLTVRMIISSRDMHCGY
jgi:hypothetical protein